ncbi:alpha/beta fold hydrolase [Dankookia sp. P2]|uniref:alpha/beta fold hydrolase n=1 Tax=Dankookia sp. P2 TaxID=3423955 RepID=UPI003D67B689
MSVDRRTALALPLAIAAIRPAAADPLDAVESRLIEIGDLRLGSGTVLPGVRLAYETYGTLNAAGDNAVLITHGYTSSHHAAGRYAPGKAPPGVAEDAPGSWDLMIGPGKPIDTDRFYVVSSNMLGSSYGSTAPASINPATGQPWGPDFPAIAVTDIVAAQRTMLGLLGVRHLVAVMGTSYGGYQAFQWAVTYPEAMNAIIAVNTAPKGSGDQRQTTALVARLAEDANWNGGRYYANGGIQQILTDIRVATLKNYGIEAQLNDRFPDPEAREAEIRRLATPWARAFDGNSLVVLRRAAVDFDAQKDFGQIKAKVLYALTTTDRLFPPSIAPAVMQRLAEAGVDADFFEIRNESGHIGANVDSPGWVPRLAEFMRRAAGA